MPANVASCLYGIDFLRALPAQVRRSLRLRARQPTGPLSAGCWRQVARLCGGTLEDHDVALREDGYLFLASTEAGAATLAKNVAMQQSLGVHVHLSTPSQLAQRFPWCHTGDILVGAHSTRGEGVFDPWRYLNALRLLCKAVGVRFVAGRANGLAASAPDRDGRIAIQQVHYSTPATAAAGPSAGHSLPCDVLVNAAGPFAADLLRLAGPGLERPVRARKRHICACLCPSLAAPPPSTPLTVDPSGVYFRPERSKGAFIVGVSPDAQQDPDCASVDSLATIDHTIFEETLWPALYHRVPTAFDSIKVSCAPCASPAVPNTHTITVVHLPPPFTHSLNTHPQCR